MQMEETMLITLAKSLNKLFNILWNKQKSVQVLTLFKKGSYLRSKCHH